MTSIRVARGQTLGQIAQEYGVSLRSLARANGIANVNQIRAGSTLSIPDHFDRGRATAGARRASVDSFVGAPAPRGAAAPAGAARGTAAARGAPREVDGFGRIGDLR